MCKYFVYTQEDGTTPLMKACNRRNFVVQKLLLLCGADPNIRDLRGITALHIVAESGDIDSMKLLIAYQAAIDTADKFGCTPLHYASNRKQLEASDLLIFCGADAYEEDEWWRTPMTVCADSDIMGALKESEMVLNGIKNKDIFIQTVELESNKTYILENLELTIAVPETFKTNSLSFLCRRIRPEYSHPSLRPKGRELLISDTFEYRISTVQINGTVTLEIPLYDFPDPFEEVYMKTDKKPDIDVDEKLTEIHRVVNEANPSKLRWFCRATIDITKFSAFNLVTFPKVENFRVGQEGGKFSSKVDKFVHMSVEPDTFEEEGTLSLEVIPSPSYRKDVYKDIVSVSHFYDITFNASVGHIIPENMTLFLPLPQYYSGDGDLYLLSARMTSNHYVDDIFADDDEILDSWELLDKNPATRRGKIITQLPHLSIFVLAETKKNLTTDEIKLQTDSLLRRASKRKTFIVFFSLLKPIGYDIYDLVVECTTPQKRLERVNYWLSKRYLHQSNESVKEFDAQPGKEFHITIKGNIKQFGFVDSYDVRLQFHPKRRNFQRLQVTMKNKDQVSKGLIYIREFNIETDQKVPVTNIDVHLTGEPFIEDIVPVKSMQTKESTKFKGFTRDKFLRSLAHLIEDDWVKISLMLGLSYKTVDDIRMQSLQATYEEQDI
ncbi:hypothetical protein KUTeg_016110 [Tegillarca granosa]|uniref:ANK_REP_REGION domain-containing protein n=1 Tax=Tegillarca granosa TaxID=220873 RepID=A0ABQ9EQ82_TEGGR|nr:hypothetical protein KUTeg_016110 [Tegillarca granosa]